MDQKILFDTVKLDAFSPELLRAVLDSLPFGIEVLEAIYEQNKIADFAYILINKVSIERGITPSAEKTFLTRRGDEELFRLMKNVMESGQPESCHRNLIIDDEPYSFFIRCSRLGDGVLLSYEDISWIDASPNITENKVAEEALHKSEAQLAAVLKILPVGVGFIDINRRLLFSNKEMRRYLPNNIISSMDEDRSTRWLAYHPDGSRVEPHDFPSICALRGEHAEPGMEMLYIQNDGSQVWTRVASIPVRDSKGRIIGAVSTVSDITALKRSEEALSESEARLTEELNDTKQLQQVSSQLIEAGKRKIEEDTHLINQIVETTPDIIYILDLNTQQLIYSNRSIAAKLGYSKQQIAQMKNSFLDLLHEDDRPAMKEHLKKMKTISRDDKILQIEYRMKNAKGGVNWFCDRNSVFKRNQHNIPVEKIGICQDITQRKLEEEENITSLNILEQTEKISPIGCWEYDLESGVFKWSDGMYRLFNLSKDTDIAPGIYLEYCAPEYRIAAQRIVNNITMGSQDFEELIGILPPGQDKKIVKIKAGPLNDKKKNPVKMIGIDLDITQQVHASNEINDLYGMLMSRTKDLETLNTELKTFNTITSRDYKETLQILYTNLEYIVSKDGRLLSDTSKANIRRAQSAIQRMKLLTDDISNYLQLYDLGIHRTLINAHELLKDVLEGMKDKLERANAKVEMAPLPPLYSDPFLFALLLRHLIDNAINFKKIIVPPVIKIKYSQADEINAVPQAIKDTPYTIISISDNGIGFDEEHADKIFDLFYIINENRKTKGSGIGLAICKKIMQMHVGFITAEGTTAHGATFNCYFPAK